VQQVNDFFSDGIDLLFINGDNWMFCVKADWDTPIIFSKNNIDCDNHMIYFFQLGWGCAQKPYSKKACHSRF